MEKPDVNMYITRDFNEDGVTDDSYEGGDLNVIFAGQPKNAVAFGVVDRTAKIWVPENEYLGPTSRPYLTSKILIPAGERVRRLEVLEQDDGARRYLGSRKVVLASAVVPFDAYQTVWNQFGRKAREARKAYEEGAGKVRRAKKALVAVGEVESTEAERSLETFLNDVPMPSIIEFLGEREIYDVSTISR